MFEEAAPALVAGLLVVVVVDAVAVAGGVGQVVGAVAALAAAARVGLAVGDLDPAAHAVADPRDAGHHAPGQEVGPVRPVVVVHPARDHGGVEADRRQLLRGCAGQAGLLHAVQPQHRVIGGAEVGAGVDPPVAEVGAGVRLPHPRGRVLGLGEDRVQLAGGVERDRVVGRAGRAAGQVGRHVQAAAVGGGERHPRGRRAAGHLGVVAVADLLEETAPIVRQRHVDLGDTVGHAEVVGLALIGVVDDVLVGVDRLVQVPPPHTGAGRRDHVVEVPVGARLGALVAHVLQLPLRVLGVAEAVHLPVGGGDLPVLQAVRPAGQLLDLPAEVRHRLPQPAGAVLDDRGRPAGQVQHQLRLGVVLGDVGGQLVGRLPADRRTIGAVLVGVPDQRGGVRVVLGPGGAPAVLALDEPGRHIPADPGHAGLVVGPVALAVHRRGVVLQ